MDRNRSRAELQKMLLTLHQQRDRAHQLDANELVLKLTDEIDAVRSAIATMDVFERIAQWQGATQ